MNYLIKHTIEYNYDETVGFTPQLIRLFPRMDDRLRLTDYELSVFPEGSIYWLRDAYDNTIAKYFTTEKAKQLSVTISIDIEHRQESAFDFLLDNHSIQFPFNYTDQEYEILKPYLSSEHKDSFIGDWLKEANIQLEGNTTECLTGLISHIHQCIKYSRRETPDIQAPLETLKNKSGTCRDYAVLLIATCSYLGLASRFVSGYLYAADDENCLGADSLHAWADVYLPGAGWRGLDPTNGIWCSHAHIPLAVSCNPSETTPIEGSYCANQPVHSRMKTHLNIQNPSCHDADK